MASDWQITFILVLFSTLIGFGWYYYDADFDDYGNPIRYNLTYDVSDDGSIIGVNTSTSEGLNYLKTLDVNMPDQTPLIVKTIFGTLFFVFLALLIYRFIRSGSG